MALFRIITGEDLTLNGILNYLTDYEIHPLNTVVYLDCFGICIDNMAYDMMFIKEIYNKTSGKQYHHIILSLEKDESYSNINLQKLIMASIDFANYIYQYDRVQLAFAVHTNTDNWHCHFILNSIKIDNGNRLNFCLKDLERYRNILDIILFKYGFSKIIRPRYEKFNNKNYSKNILKYIETDEYKDIKNMKKLFK